MHATVGERIVIHGKSVGAPDRRGTIVEVRGAGGDPPFLVTFDDGHEALMYPGPDCSIERLESAARQSGDTGER